MGLATTSSQSIIYTVLSSWNLLGGRASTASLASRTVLRACRSQPGDKEPPRMPTADDPSFGMLSSELPPDFGIEVYWLSGTAVPTVCPVDYGDSNPGASTSDRKRSM